MRAKHLKLTSLLLICCARVIAIPQAGLTLHAGTSRLVPGSPDAESESQRLKPAFLLGSNGEAGNRARPKPVNEIGSGATSDIKPIWAGISVSDVDASSKWYTEKLHFTVYKTMSFPDKKLKIAFLSLNGFTLELIQFGDSLSFETVQKRIPELKERDRLQGFVKLGFQVSQVDTLAAELKRSKVKLLMEPTDDRAFHTRFLMVQDPDGNVLQFFEMVN